MSAPTMSQPERRRLAALRRYRVLDTVPEPRFDDIAVLASQICNVPIALITLLDEERAWFKAAVGLSAESIPRDLAPCDFAIRDASVLELPDLAEDERFATSPLVNGEPALRFYAGAPLVTDDGCAIGTLCVVDRQPRHLSDVQLRALEILRDQVMAQLELRRRLFAVVEESDRLESRVRQRTLALDEEVARRRAAEKELRALSRRLRSLQEEERRRLAREVHDHLGQQLTALAIDVHRLRGPQLSPKDAAILSAFERTVADSIDLVRRIATDLRPAVLDDLGLVAAFRGELQRFQERTGIQARFRHDDDEPPPAHATALFRILQEALTNIVRHARARCVEVTYERDARSVTMCVRDDGVGIDPDLAAHSGSLGLIGIRERAGELGGTSSLAPDPRGGTILRVDLPLEPPARKGADDGPDPDR